MKPKHERKPGKGMGTVVLWSLFGLIVVTIIIMGLLPSREETVETIAEKAVLVRTQTVELQSIRDVVSLPGKVAAAVSAELSVEKGGHIVALEVDRGDGVSAGQVLLRLDDRVWKVQEKQAAIALADAERDLERWEKLKGSGAVSSSDYDAIRSRRDLAAVAVEQAQVLLSQCLVSSPVDGVVDARYVELGEYMAEGQAVFRVVSVTPLRVKVNVPERDVLAVTVGMPLSIRYGDDPTAFTGRVSFVATESSPAANTFSVELTIESPPPALKPGMIVDVDLLRSNRAQAIVVPFSAVVPKRGKHVAFVVEAEHAVLRVVQIDAIVGSHVVLASGVSVGETLVVEGHRTLRDGVLVTLAETAAVPQE